MNELEGGRPAPEIGLRELKKRMTHESIADAALQLTVEKGLDSVTIDEIARQAFVSPRTVSNYFSSKEEAVVVAGAPAWITVVEQFGEGPHTERPLAMLRDALAEFAESCTEEQLRICVQSVELVGRYPALRPYQTAEYDKLEEALRIRVAQRTDTDVESDMYPWLVAAAAVAALRSAMRLWAQRGGRSGRLPFKIRDAFDLFSEGLPAPSRERETSPAT
ncbi:TetR/AcrR family transcriptional regulator [Georgenia sp. MJ206]|uniref:TetR/AcrR family transcriptional regulator n=1 Tax=Georgenia wangjunii TaxID=3117730 RepID=UPI002F26570B